MQLFSLKQPSLCRITLHGGGDSRHHLLAGLSCILCVWSWVFKFLATYSALTGFFSDFEPVESHMIFSSHCTAAGSRWFMSTSGEGSLLEDIKTLHKQPTEMCEQEQIGNKKQLLWPRRCLLSVFIVYADLISNVSPLVSGECLLQPL